MTPASKRPHPATAPRWVLATAVLLACAAPCMAQEKKPKLPPPPTDLAGHVEYLAAQLYAVPLDESGPQTGEIEKLVLDHMGQWLAAHPPGDESGGARAAVPYNVQVRRELESVFGKLRNPFEAAAAAFTVPLGKSKVVGLGYTLSWTDFNSIAVVALYEDGGDSTRPPAVAHLVPATNLHFRQLAAPAAAPGQLWFLAYGTRPGKSHPRLSAVLFAFDGQSLKPLWKRLDLFDGKVLFAGNRILISYLNEDEFKQALISGTSVVRHEAAYHEGPKGLETEYDH